MIVLPDTTTSDSSIRLVQLVGGATKVNMLKVCNKLDLVERTYSQATTYDGCDEEDNGRMS